MKSQSLLFAALLLAGNAGAAEPTPIDAGKKIELIEKRLGGRLGVAALDTGSSRRIEHRAGERFPMCSTFKFLAAAAVLHRVDEKKEQLTRFIPYTEVDLLEHAPVTREHVSAGGMTLAALCAAAIEYSDNTAANLLVLTIGGPEGFTRYARSLGDKQTRLDRLEPELNSAVLGDERDTTTPGAMVANLRTLLLGNALSQQSRQQLETWLAENKTGGEMIRAGLPNDWKTGDKTGREATARPTTSPSFAPRARLRSFSRFTSSVRLPPPRPGRPRSPMLRELWPRHSNGAAPHVRRVQLRERTNIRVTVLSS